MTLSFLRTLGYHARLIRSVAINASLLGDNVHLAHRLICGETSEKSHPNHFKPTNYEKRFSLRIAAARSSRLRSGGH